jgi:hypothetical protein
MTRRVILRWIEKSDTAMDDDMTVAATVTGLSAPVARMLAVEILLADPQALADDVLETCLYLLRERLRAS